MMENKIRCEVKNCIYHTKQDHCTASCIEVGNKNACKCGETVCNTFELNDKAVKG
ncbi:MAG: DUF1540 domain-containing protein [Clostridia bacterium]|nr:DUF1540 domain-containing protein [Clostridia bacterium]